MTERRTPHDTKTAILRTGVIGIVRTDSADRAVELTRCLWDAGIDVVEVALTTPQGLQAIERLAADATGSRILGAGTVLDAATARVAVLSGAELLVTPTLVPGVIEVGQRYGALTIIGCSTPTEMLHATTLGADLVKVFPASLWSPKALRDVLAALPQLQCVPTGGITVNSAASWIDAGSRAVGIGSALTQGEDPAKTVRSLLDAIRAVRP